MLQGRFSRYGVRPQWVRPRRLLTPFNSYGAYIALPLIRKAWREDLTKEEAVKLLQDCMRVLFYRDARSTNKASGICVCVIIIGVNLCFV